MRYPALVLLSLFFTVQSLYAQDTSKISSTKQVYINFIGVGAAYEQALDNQISIVAAVGYTTGIRFNSYGFESISTLGFSLEPRWYYNYAKRVSKGKNAQHNAANFFSVRTQFQPNLLTQTQYSTKSEINKNFSIAPMWNIRRNIGQSSFNYEFGIGFEHLKTYARTITHVNNGIALNLQIGYTF